MTEPKKPARRHGSEDEPEVTTQGAGDAPEPQGPADDPRHPDTQQDRGAQPP